MDFLYYLAAVLVGLLLMGTFLVARVRNRKKPLTIENIGAAMSETKDDPDEPARWVP